MYVVSDMPFKWQPLYKPSTKLKIGVPFPKIEVFMLQQIALPSECTLNSLFELSL